MGRLRPLSQGRVICILKSNGFQEVRSGKHITFKKTSKNGRILTTWVPHHRLVTVFVTQYIIKQSEKPRMEFES